MLTIDDLEYIQQALRRPLPGRAGQIHMAPYPSNSQYNRWEFPDTCREAGVLLLLYPHMSCNQISELYLVLTRRPDTLSSHRGQISFPGGRREEHETLETTAVRETSEELGIPTTSLKIIGRLTALYTPPSNFCIYPFVAISATRPDFQPNLMEVAEVIEVPLNLLLKLSTRKEETWYFENYGERQIPFYDVFGHKVWGATAMILSEFLTVLAKCDNSNN